MTAYREVDYTNYEGKRALRRVVVRDVYFGTFEPYHREPQWLIKVWDVDREAERVYAQSGVHAWDGVPVAQAPDKAAEREGLDRKRLSNAIDGAIDKLRFCHQDATADELDVAADNYLNAALAPKPTGTEASRGVGAETRYQYREIGEGQDWQDCSKMTYDGLSRDPNMDTREIAATPTPSLSPDRMGPAGAVKEVCETLQAMIDAEVEYMTTNLLGDPEKQHNVKRGRAALAALTPSAPIAAPVRDDGARERLRQALLAADWSDVSIGNKALIQSAIIYLASLPAPAGDVPGEAQTQEGRR